MVTGEITSASIIVSSSSLTLCISVCGILRGVNKATGWTSLSSVILYLVLSFPNPVNSFGNLDLKFSCWSVLGCTSCMESFTLIRSSATYAFLLSNDRLWFSRMYSSHDSLYFDTEDLSSSYLEHYEEYTMYEVAENASHQLSFPILTVLFEFQKFWY